MSFPLTNFTVADQGLTYDLRGVVNHYGTMESGHYTANCFSSIHSKWHKFDDSQVSRIHPSRVLTKHAYILFFSVSSGN